jgi:hypothetical protein
LPAILRFAQRNCLICGKIKKPIHLPKGSSDEL